MGGPEDGGWIAFDTRDRSFVGAFRVRLGTVAILGWAILFGSLAGWVASGARAPWVPQVPVAAPPTACANCGLTVCGGCTPGQWVRFGGAATTQLTWTTEDMATVTTGTTVAGVIEMLRGGQ